MSALEGAERVEWSRLPELPGTETLLVENSLRLWRVYHDTYTIRTCLDSAGTVVEWTYRRQVHSPTARSCMLMEPGELHVTNRLTPPGRVSFRALMISPSLVAGAAHELGMRSSPVHLKLAVVPEPAFFRASAALHASLVPRSPGPSSRREPGARPWSARETSSRSAMRRTSRSTSWPRRLL